MVYTYVVVATGGVHGSQRLVVVLVIYVLYIILATILLASRS